MHWGVCLTKMSPNFWSAKKAKILCFLHTSEIRRHYSFKVDRDLGAHCIVTAVALSLSVLCVRHKTRNLPACSYVWAYTVTCVTFIHDVLNILNKTDWNTILARGGRTTNALRRVPHQNSAWWRTRGMLQSVPRHLPVLPLRFHIYVLPVYVVTYNVIFSSVNLRNIVTDKVNVVIFTCDVDVCIMHQKFGEVRLCGFRETRREHVPAQPQFGCVMGIAEI